VKFLTWTEDNLLRQVVYEGLREDKPAKEVQREVPHPKIATGGRAGPANQIARCALAISSKRKTPPSWGASCQQCLTVLGSRLLLRHLRMHGLCARLTLNVSMRAPARGATHDKGRGTYHFIDRCPGSRLMINAGKHAGNEPARRDLSFFGIAPRDGRDPRS
jgi:hypothetical protein